MHWSFYIVSGVTLVSAIGAMALRNIVHCALLLTVTFAGLALLYLQLDAQFVGFAQILVYIGAVAILIVFAILLTRSSDLGQEKTRSLTAVGSGVLIAIAAFILLAKAVLISPAARKAATAPPVVSVEQIGKALMNDYVLPLEVMALLLTAALIGAAVIALQERRRLD